MKPVNDSMVQALRGFLPLDQFTDGDLRAALEAALVAAPAIDGWVWCGWEETGPTKGWACVNRRDYVVGGCPGPHRTLVVGPLLEGGAL